MTRNKQSSFRLSEEDKIFNALGGDIKKCQFCGKMHNYKTTRILWSCTPYPYTDSVKKHYSPETCFACLFVSFALLYQYVRSYSSAINAIEGSYLNQYKIKLNKRKRIITFHHENPKDECG